MVAKAAPRWGAAQTWLGIGMATAAAHIGNNFSIYLTGGLIDRYGFSPIQMGSWNMAETLAYAAAMFVVAPRVEMLSPRKLMLIAGMLVSIAQLGSAVTSLFPLLVLGRIGTGLGFGITNTALNVAAGRTTNPARAISAGIAIQTALYVAINVALPMVGAKAGVAGMFLALGCLSALFTLGAWWLPNAPKPVAECANAVAQSATSNPRRSVDRNGIRILAAMALFTFGSLAIWPFMERAAHAIGISAVAFGRYQSVATLASALGSIGLAAAANRLPRTLALTIALTACGGACALLTLVSGSTAFALALIVYNISWLITYPLLLGIAYANDPGGRLAVLCSAVWLSMVSLGALTTGIVAELLGGYRAIGPLGLVGCLAALAVIWPLLQPGTTRTTVPLHPRTSP